MPKTKQCSKCGANRLAKFYKTPRSRVCTKCQKARSAAYSRETHLRETYGISMDEYDQLLQHQDGRCYICGGKRQYNLHVDHCHKTGLVRGLLCKGCNKRLLPSVRDNVDRLNRAIEYLQSPPAFAVIGERVAPCEQ